MPLALAGATSGSTTLQATDAVTATLTLPSSTGTLLSTANPQSGGVIQMVSVNNSTSTSTTSSTYQATNLSASITPKFATSKIMVIISTATVQATAGQQAYTTVYRNGSVNLGGGINSAISGYENNGGSGYSWVPLSGCVVDSPATTSSTTYTAYIKCGTSGTAILNWGALQSTITLLEIAA